MKNLEELINDEETIFGSARTSIWHKDFPLPSGLKKITTGMGVRNITKIFEGGLTKLEDVDCWDCCDFNERIMKQLKRLVVWRGTGFGDKTMKKFPYSIMENLKKLVIRGKEIKEEKPFEHFRTLEELKLIGVIDFTGSGLKYLGRLRKLSIYGGYNDVECTILPENILMLKSKNLVSFKTDGFYTSYLTEPVLKFLGSMCRVIRLCCKGCNYAERIKKNELDISKMIMDCKSPKCKFKHFSCEKCRTCPSCSKVLDGCKVTNKECNLCKKEVCGSCISSSGCELCHRSFCSKCRTVKHAFCGWPHLGEDVDLEHLCIKCLYSCMESCGFCRRMKCVQELRACDKCEKLFCFRCSGEEKYCKKCEPKEEDDYYY